MAQDEKKKDPTPVVPSQYRLTAPSVTAPQFNVLNSVGGFAMTVPLMDDLIAILKKIHADAANLELTPVEGASFGAAPLAPALAAESARVYEAIDQDLKEAVSLIFGSEQEMRAFRDRIEQDDTENAAALQPLLELTEMLFPKTAEQA